MGNINKFINSLRNNRRLVVKLALKDLRDKYLGSYLGVIWAFIQPTVTILIFWFLFQIGFRAVPIEEYPYILWLMSGMLPWFFFSEALMNATNSITSNVYLIKNVQFKVTLLPLVKIISPLIIHASLMVILMVMFSLYGYQPNVYNLQIIYYMFAMIIFLLSLSWITSALVIFLKDIGQIISMILQFGFWITPIFWSLDMIPDKYALLMKLNPMFYLIEGYRHSLIFRSWFWQYPSMTSYFWLVTLFLFIFGSLIFKRLKPHFADVL